MRSRRSATAAEQDRRAPDARAGRGAGSWPYLFSNIRVRLVLWYIAILALILILCSGAIYAAEQRALLAQVDSRLMTRLRQLAGAYDARSGRLVTTGDSDIAQGTEIALLLSPTGRLVQTLAAGRLSAVKTPWGEVLRTMSGVARSGTPSVVDQGLALTTFNGATKSGLEPGAATRAGLFRLTGMPLSARGRVVALLVGGVRSDVPQQMATLAGTLETIVPLALILSAAGGYWLADRALRPIAAITRTAQQISATDLSRRLNLRRRDEVGQLGATFDLMLERLDAAFARQRRFTADASHELRTPLAIVDLEATRALDRPRTVEEYRQAMATIQQETGHMTRLVDDLLTLARADSGEAALGRAEVDLAEVALDVVERLEPLARQSGMVLAIETLPEGWVQGDQGALTRMLTNVVENALKYGAGSATQARIRGGRRRHDGVDGVWLQVVDDGPGIAAEHLPHVCERFYRVDPARSRDRDMAAANSSRGSRPAGSGLGLAISRWIATAHHGSLTISSAPGRGVAVDIWLPTSHVHEAT